MGKSYKDRKGIKEIHKWIKWIKEEDKPRNPKPGFKRTVATKSLRKLHYEMKKEIKEIERNRQTIQVTNCKHCPFFGKSSDGMECTHPYWEDKGAYDNMIITQENIQKNIIPEKCPLRISTYKGKDISL